MDQNLTSMLINRKDHNLKKPPAYHLDLLVCGLVVYAQWLGEGWWACPICWHWVAVFEGETQMEDPLSDLLQSLKDVGCRVTKSAMQNIGCGM